MEKKKQPQIERQIIIKIVDNYDEKSGKMLKRDISCNFSNVEMSIEAIGILEKVKYFVLNGPEQVSPKQGVVNYIG